MNRSKIAGLIYGRGTGCAGALVRVENDVNNRVWMSIWLRVNGIDRVIFDIQRRIDR